MQPFLSLLLYILLFFPCPYCSSDQSRLQSPTFVRASIDAVRSSCIYLGWLWTTLFKGAVSRNSAKLGNYKMPVELRET